MLEVRLQKGISKTLTVSMRSECRANAARILIIEVWDVRGNASGHLCIRCPWHNYNVTMAGGQLVYEGVTFDKGMFRPTGWKVGKGCQYACLTVTCMPPWCNNNG